MNCFRDRYLSILTSMTRLTLQENVFLDIVTNHGSVVYLLWLFIKHNTFVIMARALCPRTDCATVTHLYKLCPNTEQRHVIRTVRNIVREHALVHHIEYNSVRPPHGIMERLCRHVIIYISRYFLRS